MQDEERLVGRAQKGEQEAFSQLYEENFDKIYRYVIVRIGNEAEAEDLTQQVFMKALESIASFKWKGVPVSAWLFRIAHNQVVDYLRKKTKQTTVALDESIPSSHGDPEMVVENKQDFERILSATKQLTPAQQEVISLRFVSELSVAEVARVMGRSGGAVKALQHSALVALRKILVVAEDNESK